MLCIIGNRFAWRAKAELMAPVTIGKVGKASNNKIIVTESLITEGKKSIECTIFKYSIAKKGHK